jgi:hypothetical protein
MERNSALILQPLDCVRVELNVLNCGSCEALKTGVHAAALGLAVVMGAYNAAAWLRRRQPHLAINAVLYAALAAWEQQHVAHHLAVIDRQREAGSHMPVTAPKRTKVAA